MKKCFWIVVAMLDDAIKDEKERDELKERLAKLEPQPKDYKNG